MVTLYVCISHSLQGWIVTNFNISTISNLNLIDVNFCRHFLTNVTTYPNLKIPWPLTTTTHPTINFHNYNITLTLLQMEGGVESTTFFKNMNYENFKWITQNWADQTGENWSLFLSLYIDYRFYVFFAIFYY